MHAMIAIYVAVLENPIYVSAEQDNIHALDRHAGSTHSHIAQVYACAWTVNKEFSPADLSSSAIKIIISRSLFLARKKPEVKKSTNLSRYAFDLIRTLRPRTVEEEKNV
jgi:hypothetical protein